MKLHAIIVDDEENTRKAVAKTICSMGDTVAEACNQKEAMEVLARESFDYFIIDLVIPYEEDDEENMDCGYNLIEHIREFYSNSAEYPIIVMTAHGKENHYYRKAMEAGANSYLVKPFNSPENKTDLRETIKNVTQKALLKRNHKALPPGNKREQVSENTDHILEKLAAQYTLVVDLKAMRVYYKGIQLPSGKDGLQQRHMAFLFILARDAGRAMSPEDIQKEIDDLKLDKFQDRPNNIRNQIRKTLRAVARQHPDRITGSEIDALLEAVPKDMTRLTLTKNEIFSIYGKEDYPSV